MKVFLLLVFVLITEMPAQKVTKIFAYDASNWDYFGYNVTIDSKYLAITSYDSLFTYSAVGSVYLYKRYGDEFRFFRKLRPDIFNTNGNFFGSTVIFSGGMLFVGAHHRMHIYDIKDSLFHKKTSITPHDTTHLFGYYFSVYNKDMLVGSISDGLLSKGAVYFYSFIDTSWVFKQKIYASDVERKASFGVRTSFNGKYSVISAPSDGWQSGPTRGSVFLFEKTDAGWVERQKILPSHSAINQSFGVDLAINNNRIAIGAVGSLSTVNFSGRIYIYKITNGLAVLEDSVFASDNFPGNNFGYSFKLRGDSLFVGASGNQLMKSLENAPKVFQPQAAYLFVYTGNAWEERIKFIPPDPTLDKVFGYSVDFNNGNFIVGAPRDIQLNTLGGAAYLFQPNIISVKEENNKILEFGLSQNYPNPFNPSTVISYQVAAAGYVTLKVYDLLGREVTTLVNEEKPSGSYTVNFSASQLSTGVYFYELKSGTYRAVKKLMLMK